MSWMKGTGPVKDVSAYGVSKGLSENWYSDKGSKSEISGGDFWDIMDNPLYQVAAESLGYDWAEFVKEGKAKVGTGPRDGTIRVKVVVKEAVPERVRTNVGPNSMTVTTPGVPAEYDWITRDEADKLGLDYDLPQTTRYRDKKTGKIFLSSGNPYEEKMPDNLFGRSVDRKREKWDERYEEVRDWGITDLSLAEELDEISAWLSEIVNINDHLHPTIVEGPQGKHYGIEGDIWEHYGLDKEIEPPKELEWDSYDKKMNLSRIVTSGVTYSTPEGMNPIDLHSE